MLFDIRKINFKMAGNGQQSSKDRSSNFSKDETEKLVLLLKDHPTITSKKTDHVSNQQKEATWRLLADKYNSDATKHRTIKQLQQKYGNLKKTARKEMAAEKYGRRQTGGGPAPPQPSQTTEWLNSIMGESISGLPAVYDSDIIEYTVLEEVVDEVPDDGTTAKVNLDLLNHGIAEECTRTCTPTGVHNDNSTNNIILSDSEDLSKENVPNNNQLQNLNEFDSSTPKAMLRKPMSSELAFKGKKKKSEFTPWETRKRICLHTEKKMDFMTRKQQRESDLSQYAKEEHEQNLKHKQELHDLEIDFKKKMHDLILEKYKYEVEKAKLELNKTISS